MCWSYLHLDSLGHDGRPRRPEEALQSVDEAAAVQSVEAVDGVLVHFAVELVLRPEPSVVIVDHQAQDGRVNNGVLFSRAGSRLTLHGS
jgi:hypothetical protein